MFKPELRIRVYLQRSADAVWSDYAPKAFGAFELTAPTTTTGQEGSSRPYAPEEDLPDALFDLRRGAREEHVNLVGFREHCAALTSSPVTKLPS